MGMGWWSGHMWEGGVCCEKVEWVCVWRGGGGDGCVCGGWVKVGWYGHVLVVLDKTFQMSILCS